MAMIKFVQVADAKTRYTSELSERFNLKTITVNEEYIISLEENTGLFHSFQRGELPDNPIFAKTQRFTSITIAEGNTINKVNVVGSEDDIREQINRENRKQLLKG